MAKPTIFIMTHLASGWEKLVEAIHRNPRVEIFNTGVSYSHPEHVWALRAKPHRFGGAAAVWGDVILHNKDFAMRRLCQHYHMIFWCGPYEETVNDLVKSHGYKKEQAELYCWNRSEGMAQYWRRKRDLGQNPLWNPNLEDDSFLSSILG